MSTLRSRIISGLTPFNCIAVYVFAPLASQANAYLANESESARERVRIVSSVIETRITGLLDILSSMETSFGKWIAEQVGTSSFGTNRLVVGPPSYIIEDHVNGGISLTSKHLHELPVVFWWAATAASFIVQVFFAHISTWMLLTFFS
jgi:hypothetical protein